MVQYLVYCGSQRELQAGYSAVFTSFKILSVAEHKLAGVLWIVLCALGCWNYVSREVLVCAGAYSEG